MLLGEVSPEEVGRVEDHSSFTLLWGRRADCAKVPELALDVVVLSPLAVIPTVTDNSSLVLGLKGHAAGAQKGPIVVGAPKIMPVSHSLL